MLMCDADKKVTGFPHNSQLVTKQDTEHVFLWQVILVRRKVAAKFISSNVVIAQQQQVKFIYCIVTQPG